MKTPKIEKRPGVYQITNLVNGHRYIGSSVNVYNRLRDHKSFLKRGAHGNIYLQRAYDKYGEENFTASVLLYCEREETTDREQEFLDKLKPEYNIAINAAAPTLGLKWSAEQKAKAKANWQDEEFRAKMMAGRQSEEYKAKVSEARKKVWQKLKANPEAMAGIRAKMSEASKAHWQDEEYRAKRSKSLKGRAMPPCTEGAKKKISEASKAHWQDEEYRAKMLKIMGSEESRARKSKTAMNMWQNRYDNPEAMADHRAKLSKANKGKSRSEQAKAGMRERMQTVWQDEEYRKKMSEAHRGKKASVETRAKMSEGLIARWKDEEYKDKVSDSIKTAWHNRREDPEAMAEYISGLSERTKRSWQDEEQRAKRLETLNSEEHKAKLSKISKERWESDEYRAKQSAAQKAAWQELKSNPEAFAEWKAKVAAGKQRKKEEQNA